MVNSILAKFGSRREGFWSTSPSCAPWPAPHAAPWDGQEAFLFALARAEHKAKRIGYMGYSTCRICRRDNGSHECYLDEWCWPSGFRHYVEAHNVKPSVEFVSFITSMSK